MPLSSQNTWTKWWWLRLADLPTWSIDERRAATILAAAYVGVALGGFAWCFGLAWLLGLGTKPNAAVSLILVCVIWPLAREIANDVSSGRVHAGDLESLNRLGGWIPEPWEETKFQPWWLEYKFTRGWSDQELQARNLILFIALLLFAAQLGFDLRVPSMFGLSDKSCHALAGLIGLVLSICISRRFCLWMWPDFIRGADALALEREKQSWLKYRER